MSQLFASKTVKQKYSVWFTQGFSSQRDLLAALKSSSLQPQIKTIASHRQCRDEILSMADQAVIEPTSDYQHFVLQQVIEQNVQLVMVSHNNEKYEQLRPAFEQQGIRLVTGTQGLQNHHDLDNKFAFSTRCQQAGIAVVDAIQVESTEQLVSAIASIQQQQQQVCVKPVVGVFAQGFWQLKDDMSHFDTLFDPSSYQANTQQFIEAYDQQLIKRPYLAMPFLSGDECSVDGIVNAQFRQDEAGTWFVLEVNARPSGGIGITLHSQVNLVAECVAYHAKLDLLRHHPRPARVRQITKSVEVKQINYAVEHQYA